MNDKFSIDDILAEVDKKRSGGKPSVNSPGENKEIDDILNSKPTVAKTTDSILGVTQILEDKKLHKTAKEKLSKSEEYSKPKKVDKFSAGDAASRATTSRATQPNEPFKPEQAKEVYTPFLDITSEIPEEKPSKIKREKTLKKRFDTGDIFFNKAKILPKPLIEDKPENVDNDENNVPVAPISSKPNRGAAISIGGDFDFPKLENTQVIEKTPHPVDEVLKKRGEALLERDMSLEQPTEQINSINPFEMLPEDEQLPAYDNEQPEKELKEEKSSQFVSLLSGDTNGIADGDLKILAGKTSDKSKAKPTAEVKTYIPNTPLAEQNAYVSAAILDEKARRSNTALIESLNKALKEKRDSDVSAYRTLTADDREAKNMRGEALPKKPVTHGLNIDYKKQIITETSINLHEDPKFIEQKINDLAGKRKRKIRDFVLEDIDDEKDPAYYDDEAEAYEDEAEAENYDTFGQIWSDLNETHKGLKIRFFILLLITGFAVILTFMNDMGHNMAYNILGVDVFAMDKRYEPKGFLYLNLILGVIGVLTCSSVIRDGFARLFKGKADCNSLCAVNAVVGVISTVPMLNASSYFQQGYVNIFIAAGLVGLFANTTGKLIMMTRAKRNFKFVSGDNQKYFAEIINDDAVTRAFTKGAVNEMPILASMRKTEFLADFLKNCYCNDKADQLCKYLTPVAFGAALIVGIGSLFLPYENEVLKGNVFWALTTANAVLCLLSPLSVMFLVNNPLLRASKALVKNDAVVLGYKAAEKFSKVNSVLVDASSLFPAGSVDFRNLKRCQPANSLHTFAIDDAIITAASLAIKSGSVLSSMFFDMLAGKSEMLYEIDNCIYEVNMGISGWMGSKRVMLGNREQMKHHGIKVPDIKKEQQYSGKFGDVVYLASGGETIAMFFLKIVPNPQIKQSLQQLQRHGISIIIRTRDSLVTTNSLAEAFDLNPENMRVIPFDLHAKFDECTRYSSRGDGGISCAGTFSSFASALSAAKKIMHNIVLSSSSLFTGLFLAVIFSLIFTVFADTGMFTSTGVLIYNGLFFVLMMLMQGFKRY